MSVVDKGGGEDTEKHKERSNGKWGDGPGEKFLSE